MSWTGLAIGAGSAVSASMQKDSAGDRPKPLPRTWEQDAVYQKLLPDLRRAGQQYATESRKPYPGEMTAPMTEFERMGMDTLGEYLGSPTPDKSKLFGLTTEELERTLEGKEYDPINGPYYEAYRNQVMRDMDQAKDRIAATSSSRDKFFGGGRMDQEREVEEGMGNSLATVLGKLFENERMNRLNTVPMALDQMAWAENLPQSRVQASQTLGSLPRQIQQDELDRRYNDFVRKLQMMGMSMQAAVGLATNNPQFWMPTPPDMSGIGQGMGSLAMMASMNNNQNQTQTYGEAPTSGTFRNPQAVYGAPEGYY